MKRSRMMEVAHASLGGVSGIGAALRAVFADVFSPDAFIEFERYISGLIVSERETVDGINRLFVNESQNQSSINRLLTESPLGLEDLNNARLNA